MCVSHPPAFGEAFGATQNAASYGAVQGSHWITVDFWNLGHKSRKVGLDQGIIIGVGAVLSFIALQH
jgi:hypothetical protein